MVTISNHLLSTLLLGLGSSPTCKNIDGDSGCRDKNGHKGVISCGQSNATSYALHGFQVGLSNKRVHGELAIEA